LQIRDEFLDLLTVTEVVQLRLVSKNWNQTVINYSRLQRRLKNTQIYLNDVERVADFNKNVKCLPFSSFCIPDLLKYSVELETFLQLNRRLVISLKIFEVNEGLSDFQFEFLNSLPSIKHLQIFMSSYDTKETRPRFHNTVPLCMANLDSFEYGHASKQQNFDFLFKDCTNINKLTLGMRDLDKEEWWWRDCPRGNGVDKDEWESEDDWDNIYGDGLCHFLHKRFEEKNSNTLEIEFHPQCQLKSYIFPLQKIDMFWDFVLKLQGKVKLYNVNTEDIVNLTSEDNKRKRSAEELSILLNSVKSLQWDDKKVPLIDVPGVEKLNLRFLTSEGVAQSNLDFKLLNKKSTKPWLENLKEIKTFVSHEHDATEETIKSVSKLIFDKRPLVTLLTVKSSLKREDLLLFFTPCYLSYFNNLKKLRLDCNNFNQSDYIELFSALASNTKVEQLSLEVNSVVDDEFIYGNDRNNPIFLQMSRK